MTFTPSPDLQDVDLLHMSDSSKKLRKLNTRGWRKGDKARVIHTKTSTIWRRGHPTAMTVTKDKVYDVLGVYCWNNHILVLLLDDEAEATAYSECRLERVVP